MKNAVIVCSNSGIDYINHKYDIPVFRSVINLGDKSYDDFTEIKAEDFYKLLDEDKSVFPTTAYVSIGKMVDTFNDLKSKGYDGVVVITISKQMSGLNGAILLAAEEVSDFNVVSYDSRSLAYPQTYMALEACRMFEEGKSMEEVLSRLDFIRDNNHLIFSVDTLEFLIKNGRLSKVAGAVANLMNIRPLLHIDNEGKVVSLDKTRTSKKARQLMVELFLKEVEGKDVIVYISHANAGAYVDEVKEMVFVAREDIKEITDVFLTPVVGAHCGPRAISLGYIIK
ncbi:MAG: DegV family protein [bacterium]